ncbi:MAG: CPBP family intramembrane metalloprotease [Planctomycetia bacterium]|nr:CPBP family intramembrane metalloprotease [Planctomycetia bacterium]
MLNATKRRLTTALPTLLVLVAAASGLKAALELKWSWTFEAAQWRDLGLAVLVVAASDGVLQLSFRALFGKPYMARYRAFVEFFRTQRAPEIVAAGLQAGGEELLFRGVLLEWLQTTAQWPAPAAVAAAAITFGAAHVIPRRPFLPFNFWAIWEGVLLGSVYVLSGSLAVVVILHILHDIVGFGLFAYQRRTGWLMT